MAKRLVQTQSRNLDILIADRFIADRDKENGIEWENKEQGIARGKTLVDSVIVYSTNQTDYGNMAVDKIWINASDIKAIYEAILETETITTGKEEEDLPF